MDDIPRFLSRQATIGDVIAWILTLTTIVEVPICVRLVGAVPHFKKMFDNLHATLPLATRLVLSMSTDVWELVPVVVTVVVVIVLVRTRNDMVKVVCAGAGSFVINTIVGMVLLAIIYPVLELQKQLS